MNPHDVRAFTTRYPRGEHALISPFHKFSAAETVKWFETRGVALKTESDGRVFPITDSSQTVIDCLTDTAKRQGVVLQANHGVEQVTRRPEGGFDPSEREMLRALPFVTPVTLGPRILRADTAALAALAIWQSVAGDFQ